MERDFLAAIGKEQQHPRKEKAGGGAEESGRLPRPPFAACRAAFLDLYARRAVLGWVGLGSAHSIRFGEMRLGCAAKFKRPFLSLSLLSYLFIYLFWLCSQQRVCGLGCHACRIPSDGRPAVYARFGRELMREKPRWRVAEPFGQPRVSLVDFELPLPLLLLACWWEGRGCLTDPSLGSCFVVVCIYVLPPTGI
jgi:hypothetical protein